VEPLQEGSEMSHTPGPWTYYPEVLAVSDDHANDIANPCFLRSDQESHGNGYLIAAAPDLLKTCMEARKACAAAFRVIARYSNGNDMIHSLEDEMNKAGISNGFGVRLQSAIAKATGES
jgi:hypothetical protein